MHHKGLLRRLAQLAQPSHQFHAVGVARKALELVHLGAHRHQLTKHLDFALAGHQLGAAAAADLKAGKDQAVAGLGRHRLQVVQHAPASGHATGRDDDGRVTRPGQPDALLGRDHHPHPIGQAPHFARRHAQQPGMLAVQRGGLDGHRAVQKNGQVGRNGPAALEPLQHQQQGLRAAHRKGRHQHRAATLHGVLHDVGQAAHAVFRRVGAVAVGAFDQQHVGPCHGLRRRHQEVVVATQVTGKNQPSAAASGLLQRDGAGAQQVAHRCQRDRVAFHRHRAPGLQWHQLRQRPLSVGARVQRQGLGVARIAIAVGTPCVFFLQVGTVQQQHAQQRAGRRAGVDGAAKAMLDQRRQPAAVVQVGVAEHHRVQFAQCLGHHPVALAV